MCYCPRNCFELVRSSTCDANTESPLEAVNVRASTSSSALELRNGRVSGWTSTDIRLERPSRDARESVAHACGDPRSGRSRSSVTCHAHRDARGGSRHSRRSSKTIHVRLFWAISYMYTGVAAQNTRAHVCTRTLYDTDSYHFYSTLRLFFVFLISLHM